MEKYNGFGWEASRLAVRYSTKHTNHKWQEIVAEEDVAVRHKKIDALVAELSENTEQSGFFSKDEQIDINTLRMQAFTLDDPALYYSFFDNLKQNLSESSNFGVSVLKSIVKTESAYFGYLPTEATTQIRDRLSKIDTSADVFTTPSIKAFQNMNCAACVEYASITHNLWLLVGVPSYYVVSKDVSFGGEKSQDGHAFVIIDYNNKFRMCDMVNNHYPVLNGNPIEQMFNGDQLISNNIVYANASSKELER